MKEKYLLTRADDLSTVPSDELKEDTLAKMEAAAQTAPVKHKKTTAKRILACAALVSAMFMLMSAGYRVFSYLAYVPGQGIITGEIENVYTLTEAVKAGGYYVEAMSMVPVTEGENKGMWKVTVLTNKPVYAKNGEFHEPPATLVDGDGNTVSLPFNGGTTDTSRYVGYVESAADGEYTLKLHGAEYPVTMQPLKSSVYANYQYPVSDGITVVCFPMADGSDKLIFDIILDPESENMQFWAEHCETLHLYPYDIEVTDTLGNTYFRHGTTGHSYDIPEIEMDTGINSLLSYKMETILHLDSRLEAPIARIEIGELDITFRDLAETDAYKFAVPAFGETVVPEDGGVFVDTYGITASFQSISAGFDEQNNSYEVSMFVDTIDFDFTENVTYATMDLRYESADPTDEEPVPFNSGGSYWMHDRTNGGTPEDINYYKHITGYGDKKNRTGNVQVTFGDEIIVRPNALTLGIAGDWVIDFTTPAETNE
ncbi:MAG: hypothetical protein IKV57_10700 [Clostridia bacterium]|nr:hypothetical protein [Clostridia bacterium]